MELLKTQFALRLIAKAFVEAGEEARYIRSVLGEIGDCEHLEALGAVCQDFDLDANCPV
jgi:hypothetical protein